MNVKKIVAAAVASVMAVSTMAIAASAEALMTKTGNDSSAEKYVVSFEGLTEDQVKSIVKIEASVSVTTDMVNGCIGYNKLGAWTSENQETKADEAPASSIWSIEIAAGDLATIGEDGALAPYAEIQFWWVNPVYDADGKETGEAGVATLESVKLLDASGNEVVAGGAETEAPTETEDPTETKAPTPDPGQGKPSTDTGIEGVAVVAGLAILATGAIVIAKKRK